MWILSQKQRAAVSHRPRPRLPSAGTPCALPAADREWGGESAGLSTARLRSRPCTFRRSDGGCHRLGIAVSRPDHHQRAARLEGLLVVADLVVGDFHADQRAKHCASPQHFRPRLLRPRGGGNVGQHDADLVRPERRSQRVGQRRTSSSSTVSVSKPILGSLPSRTLFLAGLTRLPKKANS